MPGSDPELYCPACGFPFGHGFPWTNSDYDEHPFYWMYSGYGFETGDKTQHRVFQVAEYNYRSEMRIFGLRGEKSEWSAEMFKTYDIDYNSNSNGSNNGGNNGSNHGSNFSSLGEKEGIVIHEDCIEAIESFLGRPFTYKDAIVMYKNTNKYLIHKNLSKYNDSDAFDWWSATGFIPESERDSNSNSYSNSYSNSNSNSNNSNLAQGDLPAWMLESPLKNERAKKRIISRLPEEIKATSAPRSRMVHTMSEHIEGLPANLAGKITSYVTGMKPREYMPNRYKVPTLHPEAMKRKRSRKAKKTRKARRAHRTHRNA